MSSLAAAKMDSTELKTPPAAESWQKRVTKVEGILRSRRSLNDDDLSAACR